jgi:hypothetical protein
VVWLPLNSAGSGVHRQLGVRTGSLVSIAVGRAGDDAKRSFEEERRTTPAGDDAAQSAEEERRTTPAGDDAERSDAVGAPPAAQRRGGERRS